MAPVLQITWDVLLYGGNTTASQTLRELALAEAASGATYLESISGAHHAEGEAHLQRSPSACVCARSSRPNDSLGQHHLLDAPRSWHRCTAG